MRKFGGMPAVALAMTSLAVVSACERPGADPVQTPAPAPASASTTGPASTELTRAELVAALALAASAHAAGAVGTPGVDLAGRSFSISLPFGCFGPTGDGAVPEAIALAGDGLASWAWSDDGRSQVLSLKPVDWTRSTLVGAGESPTWDRVDGYWIARPWLASDACPAPRPAPATAGPDEAPVSPPAAPSPFTAGLAAIQTAEGSRLGRRQGEPYRFVVRGTDGQAPPAPVEGYRVVLQGRVSSFPDGRPVHCSASSPNRRPTCIAAVVLDGVRFETAAGVRLSEWRPT